MYHLVFFAAGLSEDSDYTSDISYPIQGYPSTTSHHPNSSASQFGGVNKLTKRVNEYESGDQKHIKSLHQISKPDQNCMLPDQKPPPGDFLLDKKSFSENKIGTQQQNTSSGSIVSSVGGSRRLPKIHPESNEDNDLLYYNSRPHRKLPVISDRFESFEHSPSPH